jgi:hypothetical protein
MNQGIICFFRESYANVRKKRMKDVKRFLVVALMGFCILVQSVSICSAEDAMCPPHPSKFPNQSKICSPIATLTPENN